MKTIIISILFIIIFSFAVLLPKPVFAQATTCNGSFFVSGNAACPSGCEPQTTTLNGKTYVCCGFWGNDAKTQCSATEVEPFSSTSDQPQPQGFQAPSAADLGRLNLSIFGGITKQFVAFQTPRGIISYLLPFLFTLAGLILFVMIIWGGFEMLTGAADPKKQEAGKQRITAGIIGFLIIFASYWLAQLLQTIFGISILG